ncbi:hypothetical protein [Cupriavidus consociatus]|uniref:hypothetical protein n=1 Tax=Cupriavidus consociatus TaxID=2821357 RepID=UPI001AE79D01|nr:MULTISPECIES: hypothetical protein [unclassified Cupriavidus]MBP0625183.1 hypothetical protein [Cupriavidus sp. LEh25]MDK2661923.1 hypothetical protein [Cupriavidus sp. LEh21]
MNTNRRALIAVVTLAATLAAAPVFAKNGKFDTYTDGARAGKYDVYTEGAKSGKFDTYTDGARYYIASDRAPL